MKFTELIDLIKKDLERFYETFALRNLPFNKFKVYFESFIFKAGFQSVFLYRLSHWFYKNKLNYCAWFLTRINITLTGAEIEYNAEIGPGLFIAHPVGIVIGRGSKIGNHVSIFQGVTLGVKSWEEKHIKKFPVIGNNCMLFSNAAILGVSIGDNCIIGANSVVTKDIPDNCKAYGSPAVIHPNNTAEKNLH